MSRTRHERPSAHSDAQSRVRNAAAALADAMKRLDRAQAQLRDALDAGRQEGMTEAEIVGAVRIACSGRPDRARALEQFATRTREAP